MAGKPNKSGVVSGGPEISRMMNEKNGKHLKTKLTEIQGGTDDPRNNRKDARDDGKLSREAGQSERPVDDAYHKEITRGLRKFFDGVASEPVPDEFLDLLKRMDSDEEEK